MSMTQQRLMKANARNLELVQENAQLKKIVNEFMAMILSNPELKAMIDKVQEGRMVPDAANETSATPTQTH